MTKQFKTAINNKLKNIDIPGWVKYIATDANGEVWGFELKPKLDNKRSIWINAKSPDIPSPKQLFLFNIDFDSTNWKNTLIALETIKIDNQHRETTCLCSSDLLAPHSAAPRVPD